MTPHKVPYFHNSIGAKNVIIKAKNFMCIGALPPFDHPHVYLTMGDDDEKICPYCSTKYQYSEKLLDNQTIPEGLNWEISKD